MYYVAFPGHISFFSTYNEAWAFLTTIPDFSDLLTDLSSAIQIGRIN